MTFLRLLSLIDTNCNTHHRFWKVKQEVFRQNIAVFTSLNDDDPFLCCACEEEEERRIQQNKSWWNENKNIFCINWTQQTNIYCNLIQYKVVYWKLFHFYSLHLILFQKDGNIEKKVIWIDGIKMEHSFHPSMFVGKSGEEKMEIKNMKMNEWKDWVRVNEKIWVKGCRRIVLGKSQFQKPLTTE
jgi:hypothetical protein